MPRAALVISTWTPLQTSANATVVDFSGDGPTGSSLAFALSNVIPAHEYVLQVDGAEVARLLSNQTGFVWFSSSSSSTHDFRVLLGWRTGLPPQPPPLSASFTFSPPNPGAGQPVAFAAAAGGGYSPYTYSWRFGDGAIASGANATHTYARGGNYTALLAVTDLSGATSSVAVVVPVALMPPPPTLATSLAFTPTQPHVGDPVTFTAAASGGTPPYAYAWNFGDGSSASAASAIHAYASSGSYSVNLTVQDALSATASASTRVDVAASPPPIQGNVTVAFDFAVQGSTVTFADRSSSAAGLPIVTRFWAFGDGTSSAEVAPVHSYALTGLSASYTVVLAVCDSGGHCGSASKVITLLNWPFIILLLVIAVVAVVLVLVVVIRRRRKRRKRPENVARRARRPPPE